MGRIYAAAASASSATFDEAGHSTGWWQATLEASDPRLGHLLIVAVTPGDDVMGFAKSGRFRDKAAYRTTCETSVYVGADHRGAGVGRALYRDLLERLDSGPLLLAVAGVTQPNDVSNGLHRSLGFEAVGTFTGVGVKFGRAWDVLWFQRPLTAPSAS